jgi:hypothetical protein
VSISRPPLILWDHRWLYARRHGAPTFAICRTLNCTCSTEDDTGRWKPIYRTLCSMYETSSNVCIPEPAMLLAAIPDIGPPR